MGLTEIGWGTWRIVDANMKKRPLAGRAARGSLTWRIGSARPSAGRLASPSLREARQAAYGHAPPPPPEPDGSRRYKSENAKGTTEPRTNRETTTPRTVRGVSYQQPCDSPSGASRKGALRSVLIESAVMGRLRSFEGRKLRDALDVRRIQNRWFLFFGAEHGGPCPFYGRSAHDVMHRRPKAHVLVVKFHHLFRIVV
jgi:hypothetical protein